MIYLFIALGYLAYLWFWKKYWGHSVLVSPFLELKIYLTLQFFFQPFWIFLCGYLIYYYSQSDFPSPIAFFAIILLFLPKKTYDAIMFLKGDSFTSTKAALIWKTLGMIGLLCLLYFSILAFGTLTFLFHKVIFIIAITIYIVGICLIIFNGEGYNKTY